MNFSYSDYVKVFFCFVLFSIQWEKYDKYVPVVDIPIYAHRILLLVIHPLQQPFIKVLSLSPLGSTEKPNADMCLHAE